eukprot:snap_masked-scaffold_27-processed-gene-2.29-mRNA-1 protein AED:1.00 eAED:1.00 QI:0/0/0/0/1/1/2/0/70
MAQGYGRGALQVPWFVRVSFWCHSCCISLHGTSLVLLRGNRLVGRWWVVLSLVLPLVPCSSCSGGSSAGG